MTILQNINRLVSYGLLTKLFPEEDTIYIDGTNVEIIGTRNYFYFKEGVGQEIELNNNIKRA